MLVKRIIPCLDIQNGRAVKGINFKHLQDAGDPVILADWYAKEGADELVFLDIAATYEQRKTLTTLVKRIAHKLNIPFTVGGGISKIEDVELLLNSGADKISINTAAYKNPKILEEISNRFGSQCIVLSIDTKYESGDWWIYLNGGRIKTITKTLDWAQEAVKRGVGEILLTSIDHDGAQKGFSIEITRQISNLIPIPIIASGGAGKIEHFEEIFIKGQVDAALAASVFHFKEIKISKLKYHLKNIGLPIRI